MSIEDRKELVRQIQEAQQKNKQDKQVKQDKQKKQEEKPMNETTIEKNPQDTSTQVPQTLESIREEASIAARELSAALKTDSVSRINAAREKVKEVVKKHNDTYLSALYNQYLSAGQPVLSAVTEGYCSLLQLKESQSKDGVKVELGYTSKVIDLCALEDSAHGRVITKKGDWRFQIEALGLLFAARATKDIGGDMADLLREYRMDERARKLDLGIKADARAKDPISNKSLATAVQIVVDSILFVQQEGNDFNRLKVTNADVSYMLYTMFRKGKDKLTVSMPKKATIIATVTEVMFKLVNGMAYSAEFERIEKKVVPVEHKAA